jgi:transposase
MRVRETNRYDDAFREGALGLLARSGRSIPAVAADLGIPAATLRHWYNGGMARSRKPTHVLPTLKPPTSTAANETLQQKVARLERENEELRRANAELEMDRAILKKAAAFFVKESE